MKVVQKPVLADTIKFAYDSGHTIASHTYSHRGLATGTNSDGTPNPDKFMPMGLFMQEILWNEYLIQTYIGVRPLFLRPPFLDYNETMINMVEGMGYIPIGVNLDTKDYELIQRNPNAATVGQQIIASFKMQFAIAKQQHLGFITLQHDIFNESINTFREIVTWLRTQNVKLVSIAECVGSPDQYRPKDPNVNIALASPANSPKSLHNLNANIGLSVLLILALKFLV
ncbi:hypothetical protein BKA69DRAFT_1035850 [Paraphysoderma sedebokerense]|nr:hypothetical protein BKA69DRAFT_1035850 [Paraphysoderma sedebokerense]